MSTPVDRNGSVGHALLLGLGGLLIITGVSVAQRAWGETQVHGLLDVPVLAFATLPVWLGVFMICLASGHVLGARILGAVAGLSAAIALIGTILAWLLS
jgi:hypothetical protein